MPAKISFTLNGELRTVTADPRRPLLEVLREDLHLTGPKFGCGEGECRACTVLLNGRSTPSCLTSIGSVNGQAVLTIEGLANGEALNPVQEAVLAEGAFQCGYCTPGMILGIVEVVRKNRDATEAQIGSELETHLCRCNSYAGYKRAIHRVAALPAAEKARV
ncbi:MAG TPA: (2Fe-2S)-binding protein [Acidobacteriaceae bacterium]|nr:(2Fe-2S)-binding protein [Acidobacteriaceae bacterium]